MDESIISDGYYITPEQLERIDKRLHWLRRETNAVLLVLKRGNPLCLHYEPSLKALFFSSRYLFLRKAFGRAVITEALSNETAYLFDALRLPVLGKQPIRSIPL